MGTKRASLLRATPFVVARTPLLAFDELEAWAAGLEGSTQERREQLRLRLRRALAAPAVREALFLASPKVLQGWSGWERDPDSRHGQQVERALVRYFQRMAARATPFGLFAGLGVGRIGERVDLSLEPRASYARSTRVDNDYLFTLAARLRDDPDIRAALRWWPNSSAHVRGGRLRYVEARTSEERRSYHLVGVDYGEFVELVLRRAGAGATVAELAAAITDADPEIGADEARAFVDELIDNQVLLCDLAPAVTGAEPIVHMIEVLRRADPTSALVAELEAVAADLQALDAAGLGHAPERYQALAGRLAALDGGDELDLGRLFQVDLVKPTAKLEISETLLRELERGVALLRRIPEPGGKGALEQFIEQFQARYEEREVPLLEALDEELGIGFEANRAPGAIAGPLTAGLRFPAQTGRAETVAWGAWQRWLLRKLDGVDVGEELVLDDAELESVLVRSPPPLPDALSLMFCVAAPSSEAIEQGDFAISLTAASGPSGAELLGRFCHASPELREVVAAQLGAEQALRPDARFAELVHLGEGRIGNILCRPVLREYEIPYLGVSGAAPERQLPVQDLMICVRNGRVVLRSRRLDCEVIPRLTTAHNFRNWRSLGVYRFLCTVQEQDTGFLHFSFGALEAARYLPRVRYGRMILARAQWRLDADDLAPLVSARDAGRDALLTAMLELARRLSLPRWVVLADGDNELPIDLDNPLSVDAAADRLARRRAALLRELYPPPGAMPMRGPEGSFVHELIVCFTRRGQPRRSQVPTPIAASPRRFPPGSEWLYAKLYTGLASADRILREVVAPVRARALATGAADQWFFIRYRDDADHLRVRFRGPPDRLCAELLPALEVAARPLLDDGSIWRLSLDTYEREVERYGGPEGIELAEAMFFADSEAILAIVEALAGDRGADARWRLALLGLDRLLAELGFTLEQRARIVQDSRDGFREEFNADVELFKQIGARFRSNQATIVRLLADAPERELPPELAFGAAALERRSLALRPLAVTLRERAEAGRLCRSLEEIAWVLMHMHVNRMLSAGQRAQELILHDMLTRHYGSIRAQQRGRERSGKRRKPRSESQA